MPLLFLVIGLILIVTVVRGTLGDFAANLKSDLTGGFLKWVAAIIVIGALGYAAPLKEPSRYLLALVALVIMLTNGTGFISKFAQQISNPGTSPAPAPAGGNANLPSIPVSSGSGSSSSSGGGSGGGLLGGLMGGGGGSSGGGIGQTAMQLAPLALALV